MSTTDNFELAFQKLENEMRREAHTLDEKKNELKRIDAESAAFRAENTKQKQEIMKREEKIKANDNAKRKLEPEIRKLEEKQRKDHMEISRIQATDRDRLVQHGVKLPPSRH